MIFKLRSLPKGLKNLNEICKGLPEKERFKIHSKKFAVPFLKLLLINFIFVLIGAATCLLDGLSDTENGIMIPVWTIIIVAAVLMAFFAIYTRFLKEKYNVDLLIYEGFPCARADCATAQMEICILISLVFAFNSGLTAYTIWLLIFS